MKKSFSLLLLAILSAGFHSNSAAALACGDLIATDVTFTSDLYCDSGWYALWVVADNVTIDLNGYTLAGKPTRRSRGIVVEGRSNVTIANGVLSGFAIGVYTSDSQNLIVADSTFIEHVIGVAVLSGRNADISRNKFIKMSNYGVNSKKQRNSF